jgi:DinB superfamily
MNPLSEDLERFRRGPELLATVLTGAAGEEVDFAPAPGKWTIRQIMAHLADAELVGAHRLRVVIAEENPTLTAFDQDAWVKNLDYARRKPAQSLDTFRRLRAENYELLRELPESVYTRAGSHTEDGPLTLRMLLRHFADHAESHARELQSIRAEYKKVKGKK